jgi:hypothetical protein
MASREQHAEKRIAQYAQWGVVVQTSQVRGAHIANGLVQLLRLFPHRVPWTHGRFDPAEYEREVVRELAQRYPPRSGEHSWMLSQSARALCVTTTKAGPLSLATDQANTEPPFFAAGREHVARFLEIDPHPDKVREVHSTLAAALNADGRVYASGGSDPTTPSLSFAGYSSTHTLAGMHAVTFLGLLWKTQTGKEVVRRLHAALLREDDPHSQLVHALRLDLQVATNGSHAPDDLYPVPTGHSWDMLAVNAARLGERLLSRHEPNANKGETLMALVDLASLLLFLRLVQWLPPDAQGPQRRLLMYAPARLRPSEAISRAQQSLQVACAAVDRLAEPLVIENYYPSVHARNLGAAGGWLFPLDSRGAPRRWLCPGQRQLQTLVHSLVAPGEELAWSAFGQRALEELGIIVGGFSEAKLALDLGLGGGANSVREAGRANREHLVALGLARQESDNVVLVDGGGK